MEIDLKMRTNKVEIVCMEIETGIYYRHRCYFLTLFQHIMAQVQYSGRVVKSLEL